MHRVLAPRAALPHWALFSLQRGVVTRASPSRRRKTSIELQFEEGNLYGPGGMLGPDEKQFNPLCQRGDVEFGQNGSSRTVLLNRSSVGLVPSSLLRQNGNTLPDGVMEQILRRIYTWQTNHNISSIAITATGSQFCSGSGNTLSDYQVHPTLFQHEMILLHSIQCSKIPVVSYINGPCSGIGSRLAFASQFRIASEFSTCSWKSELPPFGVLFTLSRLSHGLGLYLALAQPTLERMELLDFGVASHYIPTEYRKHLFRELSSFPYRDLPLMDQNMQVMSVPDRDSTPLRDALPEIRFLFKRIKEKGFSLSESLRMIERVHSQWSDDLLQNVQRIPSAILELTFDLLQKGNSLDFQTMYQLECDTAENLLKTPDVFFPVPFSPSLSYTPNPISPCDTPRLPQRLQSRLNRHTPVRFLTGSKPSEFALVWQGPSLDGEGFRENPISPAFLKKPSITGDHSTLFKRFRQRVRSLQLFSLAGLISPKRQTALDARLDAGFTSAAVLFDGETDMERLERDFSVAGLREQYVGTLADELPLLRHKGFLPALEAAVSSGKLTEAAFQSLMHLKHSQDTVAQTQLEQRLREWEIPAKACEKVELIGERMYELVLEGREDSLAELQLLQKARLLFGRLAMLDERQLETVSRRRVSEQSMTDYMSRFHYPIVHDHCKKNSLPDHYELAGKDDAWRIGKSVNDDGLDEDSGVGVILRDAYDGVSLQQLLGLPEFCSKFLSVGSPATYDQNAPKAKAMDPIDESEVLTPEAIAQISEQTLDSSEDIFADVYEEPEMEDEEDVPLPIEDVDL